MSKKTKTTSDQTSHTVVTPTNPDWITTPVQSLAGRIGGLSNLDPYSLVAGANPLQSQAGAGAASLGIPAAYGQASDLFGRAGGAGASTYAPMLGQASTGEATSLLDNFSSYMSPYLGSVLDSSLRDYDVGAAQTRAQNRLALANDDVFGGSGGAIQTALSEDGIDRGRGALSSQLLNQGYQTAAGLANDDAQRRQAMAEANLAAQNQFALANMAASNDAARYNAGAQDSAFQRQLAAAAGLANVGAQQSADARGNIATQAQIGDMLRQIDQQRVQAPLSLLGTQAGLLNSLPLNLFHGEMTDGQQHGVTTTKTSDPIGALTSIGSLFAPIPFPHF